MFFFSPKCRKKRFDQHQKRRADKLEKYGFNFTLVNGLKAGDLFFGSMVYGYRHLHSR